MPVFWKCSGCSSHGHVSPTTKQVFEDKQVITGKDEKGDPIIETRKMPKLTTRKRQNPNGTVSDVNIQEVEDVEPRIFIVRLAIGEEIIQRDLCKTCFDELKPKLQKMWKQLESIKNA
jgi:hypothetical protein